MTKIILALMCVMVAVYASIAAAKLKVHSTEFKNGAMLNKTQVTNIFGCTGGNISPSLA